MSSDAITSPDADAATTGAPDHADASRRLLEQSFNDGSFDLIDQFVAPDALNHDPALPAPLRDLVQMLAPIAGAEHEVQRAEHVFGFHRHKEPAEPPAPPPES